MANYIAVHPNQHASRATVWFIDDKVARRIDAKQSELVVPKGSTPPNFVLEGLPGWTYFPLKMPMGRYYPRMARPLISDFSSPGRCYDFNRNLVATSRGQLKALCEQLERIFRTVHPIEGNFKTYGHDIRNILILAATEAETHWKGILKANGSRGESTMDYVKLLPAMKLNEFAVSIPAYPWLAPIRPFDGWLSNPSTKSLDWYDAYNAVKHDREQNFARATLNAALQAVAGVAVMLYAQFGGGVGDGFFSLSEAPAWAPDEVYAIWDGLKELAPEKFPFS